MVRAKIDIDAATRRAVEDKPKADKRAKLYKRKPAKRNPGALFGNTTEALHGAGLEYYRGHVDAIRDALSGADASTVEAVLRDYANLLTGDAGITATPEQVQKAFDVLTPATVEDIDKPGFFAGVYVRYVFYLEVLKYYREQVTNEPDTGKRRAFFANITRPRTFAEITAAALWWIRYAGEIRVTDFAGMEQTEISNALDFVDMFGPAGDFLQYVYFLREGLHVRADELGELTRPALYRNAGEVHFYSCIYAAELGALFDFYHAEQEPGAGNGTEQEHATNGKEPKQGTETGGGQILALAPMLTAFGSRGAFAAETATKDGERVSKILPIEALVEKHNESDNPQKLTVYMVQKAAEGVNILQQIKRVEPVNGIYTYETNLSEFAGLCSLQDDVKGDVKNKLLDALYLLDNLYCVFWTQKGERITQRLFTVETLKETKKENILRLHVYARALQGRPYFIRRSDWLAITGKGGAWHRFKNQLLSKPHKDEEKLLSEVFDYETQLVMAARSGEAKQQLKNVREYIRKHKPTDRKTLQQMFAKAAKDGIITYTRTQSPAGKWVYNWEWVQRTTLKQWKSQQLHEEQ